jgi:hypothetical protein
MNKSVENMNSMPEKGNSPYKEISMNREEKQQPVFL